MQSALTRPWAALRGWISRRPLIAGGVFGSGISMLCGLAGMLAFLPNLLTWFAAADWPTTEAEITASRLLDGINDRVTRPEFTFRYEWKGRTYTAQGYDLLEAYAAGSGVDHGAILQAHPVGSRVQVLVNPEKPTQAVLIRGTISGLVLHLAPLLFFLLGLVGMFFTVVTGLGWLDENSRHPVGRAIRAMGGWLGQERIIKLLFYLIFGSVIVGLAVWGWAFDNLWLVFCAAALTWFVWRASRPQPEGAVEEDPGNDD
jgi:hypothetical protein